MTSALLPTDELAKAEFLLREAQIALARAREEIEFLRGKRVVRDGDEVRVCLGWVWVATVREEEAGNWPEERTELVTRKPWIEDAEGRKLDGLDTAIDAVRDEVERRLNAR